MLSSAIENKTVETSAPDLAALSAAQLVALFRQWKTRFEERLAEGREPLTRFFESRIVDELRSRTSLTPVERKLADCCARENRAELENIASLTGLPVGQRCAAWENCQSPQEILSVLERLRRFSTVCEREALVEAADKALGYIASRPEDPQSVRLAAELVELRENKTVFSPQWVEDYLLSTLRRWKKTPPADERDMIIPLLTAWTYFGDSAARWHAVRILNRCYRRALSARSPYPGMAADLSLASECSEYVTRFNPRRLASASSLSPTP